MRVKSKVRELNGVKRSNALFSYIGRTTNTKSDCIVYDREPSSWCGVISKEAPLNQKTSEDISVRATGSDCNEQEIKSLARSLMT